MTAGTDKPMATASHLVEQLSSENGSVRAVARDAIIKIGPPMTPHLIQLLSSPDEHLRWEAAKALAAIADPASAPALVGALEDRSFGVRWLASSGLIALGRDGLRPLLVALMQNSGTVLLRSAAHRIVFDLAGRDHLFVLLKPLVDALESTEPAVSVPVAAHAALQKLDAMP